MSVHRISIVKTVQSYNFSPIYPPLCRKNFPLPCILHDLPSFSEQRLAIQKPYYFPINNIRIYLFLLNRKYSTNGTMSEIANTTIVGSNGIF